MPHPEYVLWLDAVNNGDIDRVGGQKRLPGGTDWEPEIEGHSSA